MAKTVSTGYIIRSHNQTINIDLSDYTHVVSARVRWKGVRREWYNYINRDNTGTFTTTYRPLASGYSFHSHRYSASITVTNNSGSTKQIRFLWNDGSDTYIESWQQIAHNQSIPFSRTTFHYVSYIDQTVFIGVQADPSSSGMTATGSISARTRMRRLNTQDTVDPEVEVGGITTPGPAGVLDDGVESAWYNLDGLQVGQNNTVYCRYSDSDARADVEIEFTAEPKLPAPTLELPENDLRTTDTEHEFEFVLNEESDNSASKYHARIRLDNYSTFPSPDIYESKDDQTDWEYWNGAAWDDFPVEGVDPDTKVRFTKTFPLGTFYWDIASWDGYGYGYNSAVWKFRILITVIGLYMLDIAGQEYIAIDLTITETSNGEIGEITMVLPNKDGVTYSEIDYGDIVLCAFNDEFGNTDEFRGIVRDKQSRGEEVVITAITGDGILGERRVKEDYTEQDVGLIVEHIIENYCEPLTANNVNTDTGFVAAIKAEDKTPIRVLEEIRRNYGVFYYVDKDWDMHFYKPDIIEDSLIEIRRGEE